MEDWDADLSPCNFATTHFPAEGSSFITLELRDHPFDSLHPEFLSPFDFATHESERAKGAAKASCGETAVQKGVFGESVSSLPLKVCFLKHLKCPENLKGAEKKRTLQKHPFGRPFLRTTPSLLLWRAPNETEDPFATPHILSFNLVSFRVSWILPLRRLSSNPAALGLPGDFAGISRRVKAPRSRGK